VSELDDKISIIRYLTFKGGNVYQVSISTTAEPVFPTATQHRFRAVVRQPSTGRLQKYSITISIYLALKMRRVVGNVVAARALYGLIEGDRAEGAIDEQNFELLRKGKPADDTTVRRDVIEYFLQRDDELPQSPPSLLEIVSVLLRDPAQIVSALNRLMSNSLLTGSALPTFQEIDDIELYSEAYTHLEQPFRIFPGAQADLKQKLKEYSAQSLRRIGDSSEPRMPGVFLSYSSLDRSIAGMVKACLKQYGLDVFLAHEDITPSDVWVETIQENLNSCDVFIPIISQNFRESLWTDQEVGQAVQRFEAQGKPVIIPLKINMVPYGFIGKIQADTLDTDSPEKTCERIVSVIQEKLKITLQKQSK
jgi:hypothetical protein